MIVIQRVAALLLYLLSSAPAFVFPTQKKNRISNSNHRIIAIGGGGSSSSPFFRLRAVSDDDEEGRYEQAAFALNTKRTDPRIFLTQRAIQSFIFLLISVRDPHSARWIETNYCGSGIERYHGTGMFNLTKWGTWDSILSDMLLKPNDVMVISARRRGRGHGGWSKNNPYMEERFVEFEIDIDPPSLVSRILSVREQISKEWVNDVDTIVAANDQILASYIDTSISERDDEECIAFDDDEDPDPEDCIRTEDLTAAYSDSSGSQRRAFDRNAMVLLSNAIEFDEKASSPIRKGSFDLLLLLVTQESVHRVLREYREAGEERRVSFKWLRDFYVSRLADFFDGAQEYGRADDFLEELLLTPPSVKTVDDNVELVDPLRIAEDIIVMRSEVGRDWKEIFKNAPLEHTELRKKILARQMGLSEEEPSPLVETETTTEIGEFE